MADTQTFLTLTVKGEIVDEARFDSYKASTFVIHCPCCGKQTRVGQEIIACEHCERTLLLDVTQ